MTDWPVFSDPAPEDEYTDASYAAEQQFIAEHDDE